MSEKLMLRRPPDLQQVAAKKMRNVSAWLRDYITAIKNGHLHPFTQIERKTREATRNEAWGPTGTRLHALAEASFNSTDCEIIFAVIQLRLGYPAEKWRNVYKALVLLDFLLLRGSEQCIQITNEDLLGKLQSLASFAYTSPEGKDQGVNIRYRAKAISDLVLDTERLQTERQAVAKKNRSYLGFSRTDMSLMQPFNDDQTLNTIATPRSASLRRTLSDSSMADVHQNTSDPAEDPKHLRNPGETKGVSMEVNKQHLAELKDMLALPHNRYCADCQGGGAAGRASWASINNGTFICFKCAGVHRGLGTHISKVRSCTLDTWLPEQVAFMKETGNHKANSFFEAKLDLQQKPTYGSQEVDAFIRRKYEARTFAGDGIWPPSVSPLPSARSLKRASEDGYESDTAEPAPSAAPHNQRKEPRLQGSRSGKHASAQQPSRSLSKMLSVPIPDNVTHAPSVYEAAGRVREGSADLMRFGSQDLPSYSAPAGSLAGPVDTNASLLDNDFGVGPSRNRDVSQDPHMLELSSLQVPASQPLARHPSRMSSLDSNPIETTGAIDLTDFPDHSSVPLESRVHEVQIRGNTLQSIPETGVSGAELGFQDESVTDWGQSSAVPLQPPTSAFSQDFFAQGTTLPSLSPRTAAHHGVPKLRVPRRSIGGDSDLASRVSTPAFTPRLTGLLGPGPKPSWRANQEQAGLPYNPSAMKSSFKPPAYRPQTKQPALQQATQQWSARAQQSGQGSLEELVLQALEGFPQAPSNTVQPSNFDHKPLALHASRSAFAQHVGL